MDNGEKGVDLFLHHICKKDTYSSLPSPILIVDPRLRNYQEGHATLGL